MDHKFWNCSAMPTGAAFWEGYDARLRGGPKVCPYPPDSPKHAEWHAGWADETIERFVTPRDNEPALITEPLTVDIVGDEVFIDGTPQVEASLSAEAAIETGVRMVSAGLKIGEGPLSPRKPR